MHPAAMEWISRHVPEGEVRVLDAGGRNINGSPRDLFDAGSEYVVVDTIKHRSVDYVGDILDLRKSGKAKLAVGTFDFIVYAEVAEHTPDWQAHIEHLYQLLNPGGCLVVTAAGLSRTPHSGIDGGAVRPDEYYQNLARGELYATCAALEAEAFVLDEYRSDLRAVIHKGD